MVTYQAIRVRKYEKWLIKIWIPDELGTLDESWANVAIESVMRAFSERCNEIKEFANEILHWNFKISKIQIIDTSIEGSGIIAERR